MLYGIKYRCQHKTSVGDNETTTRIEILKKDYEGSITNVLGHKSSGVFLHEYEKINEQEPLENPQQKSRLEFYIIIGDPSNVGYDGQAILDEIFSSDEDEYLMRRVVGGVVQWTGCVIIDMLEYTEGPYPYIGTITAKDLTRLSGFTYPLSEGRETIIETIADILGHLPLGLPIYTYTSWTESGIDAEDDFANQIYNDVFALREYAQNEDEADQPINCEDALNKILKNYGFILRQSGGRWNIYQLSALEDSSSVRQAIYNSAGVQQAISSVNLSIDINRIERYILPAGKNTVLIPFKSARATFEHRTKVSGITGDSFFIVDEDASFKEYSQYFVSDGTQSVSFNALVVGESPQAPQDPFDVDPGFAKYTLHSGDYYYHQSTNSWSTGYFENRVAMNGGFGISNPGENTSAYSAFLNVTTSSIPDAADGPLAIRFILPVYVDEEGDDDIMLNAHISNFTFEVNNPQVEAGGSTSIDYELIQSGNWSKNYDHGSLIFGDGPISYARSALTTDVEGSNLTGDSWKFVGDTGTVNFFNLLLKEILNSQRGPVRNLQSDLLGTYSPDLMPNHRGNSFFFLGGSLTGSENTWNGYFLNLSSQAVSDDVFNVIPISSDRTGRSSPSSSSSNGTPGGSLSDAEWEKIIGKPNTTIQWGNEIGVSFADFLKATDNIPFTGNVDFAQQYTDIGTGFAGSNFGLRGPRSSGSDAYMYFNASADRWGSKFGAAGGFARFLQDGDSPSFEDITAQSLEATGNIIAYAGGVGAETAPDIYIGDEFTANQFNVPDPINLSLKDSFFATDGTVKNKFITGGTATDVDWDDVTDKPVFAAVATSGQYSDLSGTPDLSVYDNFEKATYVADFPDVGDDDVIYLEISSGNMNRWTGSGYEVISAKLALGETSATAFRGDWGKAAYDNRITDIGFSNGVFTLTRPSATDLSVDFDDRYYKSGDSPTFAGAYFSENVGVNNSNPVSSRLKISDNGESNNVLLELDSSSGFSSGQGGTFYGLKANIHANSDATDAYGIYVEADGATSAAEAIYGYVSEASSNNKSIGIHGVAQINSDASGQSPLGDNAVAGVLAEARVYNSGDNSTSAGLVANNKSTHGATSYGAVINAQQGPESVIPLDVNYDGSTIFRLSSNIMDVYTRSTFHDTIYGTRVNLENSGYGFLHYDGSDGSNAGYLSTYSNPDDDYFKFFTGKNGTGTTKSIGFAIGGHNDSDVGVSIELDGTLRVKNGIHVYPENRNTTGYAQRWISGNGNEAGRVFLSATGGTSGMAFFLGDPSSSTFATKVAIDGRIGKDSYFNSGGGLGVGTTNLGDYKFVVNGISSFDGTVNVSEDLKVKGNVTAYYAT